MKGSFFIQSQTFVLLIIAFAGMAGSGKSSLIKELLSRRGFNKVHLRPVIEDECRRRGLAITNESLRVVATKLREEYGGEVVISRALDSIRGLAQQGHVVIDSLKSVEELKLLRKEWDVLVVAVHASPSTRFKRLLSRGLEWDPKTREEMDWRDGVELGWGVGSVIALADVMIINESETQDFKQVVDSLLDRIKKKA